jgi:uncharacterized protein (TIGR00266 family)
MQHTIEHGPSFAWLKVALEPGEQLQAEAGAMVRQNTHVEMTTHLNAGSKAGFFGKIIAIFVAIIRKFIGGETMFVNRFSAPSPAEVVLAPSLSGHIVHHALGGGKKLFVQTGSYLASTGDVGMKVRFGGLRSMLGGEGLVLLECSGTGDLWINSYGGVIPIAVNGNFTSTVVRCSSSWSRHCLEGHAHEEDRLGTGLVCESFGTHRITHHYAVAAWAHRF